MTVYELISDLDMRQVAKGLLEQLEEPTGDLASATKVLTNFVNDLLQRTPICSDDEVILVFPSNSEGNPLSAHEYLISEILHSFVPDEALESIGDVHSMTDDELEQTCKAVSLPQRYGFSFVDWDRILGYQVDPDNLQKIGRDNAAAAILFEITFFGFNEENMKKERDELHRRHEELQKILELPAEEQKKHLISAEELFEELKEKYDLDEEDCENEEHAYEVTHREMMEDCLRGFREEYAVLKQYWESHSPNA